MFRLGIGIVLFMLSIHTFIYHVEVDEEGKLQIHNGTKWLAPVFSEFSDSILDTGFTSSQLTDDHQLRYPVLTGNLIGV